MKNEKSQLTIKTYTFGEVFKKRGVDFERGYAEESLRLTLAAQIKDARIQKHLTQAAVAKQVGMPQSVVARMESGAHSVSVDTLGKIAHVLGKQVVLA